MLKYRQNNREKMREYDRKRYHEKNRNEPRRAKAFAGKFCRICSIRLDSKYGAKGTRVHCRSCADNKRMIQRRNMVEYRARKHSQLISQRVQEQIMLNKERRLMPITIKFNKDVARAKFLLETV